MGSAAAYFLAGRGSALRVAVVEPDPTYELCSTLRASGGCRVQFSCPENIEMSKFSIDFIRAFPEPVDWVDGGYLLMARPGEMHVLEANFEKQRAHGCEAVLLDAHGLKRLASGAAIEADHFVNAAGAWSGLVGEMAGMPLPIAPLRRFEHFFTPRSPMERLPYVKDFQRMAFRSERKGFSGGVVDGDEPRGFNFEVDHDYFERVVWPAVAHRFPPLEAARCHRTWAGRSPS